MGAVDIVCRAHRGAWAYRLFFSKRIIAGILYWLAGFGVTWITVQLVDCLFFKKKVKALPIPRILVEFERKPFNSSSSFSKGFRFSKWWEETL
jgi:hypothetical protein